MIKTLINWLMELSVLMLKWAIAFIVAFLPLLALALFYAITGQTANTLSKIMALAIQASYWYWLFKKGEKLNKLTNILEN